MPVGDVTGWHQVFADNFANESVPVGAFSGCAGSGLPLIQRTCSGLSAYPSPYQKWWAYGDGWKDTSGNGTYYPSRVMSIANGVMNLYIHTATINGTTYHMVSTPVPKIPGGVNGGGLLYGRYIVRFRVDSLPGYKIAFMLWPDSNNQPLDGEIDFPEQNRYGDICGYMHWMNTTTRQQDAYCSTVQVQGSGWHTAETDWTPTACTFKLDGTVLGNATDTINIPSTPMHWNLQAETSVTGVIPSNTTAGNIQIDWATAYTRT
jgi:beta-glucanase (GH16 family)